MKPAVLTCDYLVSPAHCEPAEVPELVDELRAIKRAVTQCGVLSIVLEDNALDKLKENNEFPSERIFEKRFGQANYEVHSARDVARTVHAILINARHLSDMKSGFEIELGNWSYEPAFHGRSECRRNALESMVKDVGLRNEYDSLDAKVVHRCRFDAMPVVTLTAEVRDIYPEIAELPCQVVTAVPFVQDWRTHLASQEHLPMYRQVECADDLKAAIYCAAASRAKSLGKSARDLHLDAFSLSADFLPSLARNQCLGDGNFAGATISALADILADSPTTDSSIFTTEAGGNVPRRNGEYVAYRVHLTKGGVGLRLMYWRNPNDDHIVFANVGPKGEERIAALEIVQTF